MRIYRADRYGAMIPKVTRTARKRLSKNRWHSAMIKIRCGDSNLTLTICLPERHEPGGHMEIGGVNASRQFWRKILLPLLEARKETP